MPQTETGTVPLPVFNPRAFETQPRHSIRRAQLHDLPALEGLEAACWKAPIRASRAELQARIERFPQGQYVLEQHGRLVAAIYSQRIDQTEALKHVTTRTVGNLHVSTGPLLQLLALNALPEMTPYGLGDQLLEFMLRSAAGMDGVEQVVAVTLCKNYNPQAAENTAQHSPRATPAALASLEAYIRQRDAHGVLVDPILRFHEHHGATVLGIIPGYRPHDVENLGAGILIAYDIHQVLSQPQPPGSRPAHPQEEAPQRETQIDAERLLGVIQNAVENALQAKTDTAASGAFSAQHSFQEMGLDSLDLYGLRVVLTQEVGRTIEPTFFFQYPTPHAVLGYFQGRSADAQPAPAGLETALPPQQRGEALVAGVEEASQSTALRASTNEPIAEPIAIIGMGCRFPGGANSPEAFWTLLEGGRDTITEIPDSRRRLLRPKDSGRMHWGGFLDQIDRLDARFFRISPKEAASLDPQHRLLLEVSWEALEHAGVNPTALAGSSTGIFTGLFTHDYELLQIQPDQHGQYAHTEAAPRIDAYFGTGTSASLAAGRVAYFLGSEGPALTVNTACSSSLVAVHLACQSLRRGESSLALASGVSVLLAPHLSRCFSQAGMLSPSGRCRTFAADADGYVRSEGCGVVVLKRLSQAQKDGDPILAILRGTAINQDGASNGLTAPNGRAQTAVIRHALADAEVLPQAVSYVETHGTGTRLGDPIEVEALAQVYGQDRAPDNPLVLGSVKTNIGHTEAAAGIAGLIKVVLSLQHRRLPPHLHLHELNPLLALDTIPAEIPTQQRAWRLPENQHRRLAGVSSFGFSGTNAHAIVEEAPAMQAPASRSLRPTEIFTLSAMSEPALAELAAAYGAYLDQNPDIGLADLCYTVQTGRAQFDCCFALPVSSVAELRTKLQTKLQATLQAKLQTQSASFPQLRNETPSRAAHSGPIAFLFTGQGAQYANMARELYVLQPRFRHTLEQCAEILATELERPLLEILFPEPGLPSVLDETVYTQPALFAVEYALAQLWIDWGVKPQVVLGHSVGEYVAACVAGVFRLEAGLKLIAARARLMQALPPNGAMVAVLADEDTVREELAASHIAESEVSIAAINGPTNVVIAGVRQTVERVAASFAARQIQTAPLRVSHAFHSALMEPMLADFAQVARTIDYQPPQLELISNLTGRAAPADIATPAYWVEHVRHPVRFAEGMHSLAERHIATFIEIGPSPTLLTLGQRCLAGRPTSAARWLASLRPNSSDWQTLMHSLAAVYVAGTPVDWDRLWPGNSPQQLHKLPVPTYPFQRQRYWFASPPLPSPPAPQAARVPATSWVLDCLMQKDWERLVPILEQVERLSDTEVEQLSARLQAPAAGRTA